MSPASQGALEVERYIGSCLISSVRAGLHGGKSATVCRKQEQQPATVRGSKVRGCYNNGGQSYPGLADQQQQHQQQQQQQQQCQVQYAGPGGWTGAPLISMTSSPRRCNQRSSPSLGQQQQQTTCCADQQQTPPGGHKSPLSRLAIHTQGAPLILAGRFYTRGNKVHANNSNSGSSNGAVNMPLIGAYGHNSANPSLTSNVNGATKSLTSRIIAQRQSTEITMKKQPSTTIPANPKTNPNSECSSTAGKENAGSSSIANIDSLSIASDESSGSNNSENSLPRIIKPRKRRKKDRKPPNNVVANGVVDGTKSEEQQLVTTTTMTATTTTATMLQRQQSSGGTGISGDQMGVVKSYAPTCYEPKLYEAVALRNYSRRPPAGHHREIVYGGCRAPTMPTTEMTDGISRQQRYHRHHVQVKVLDDNRNVVSAPMRAAAALPKGYRHHHHLHHHHHHHHHANGNGNCNSSLPRRYIHEYAGESCEAAVRDDGLGHTCQCRYCDPAGLIWDVDRNGFSPFLTVPSLPAPPPSSSSSTSSSAVDYCPRGGHFGQIPLFLTQPGSNLQERALDRLFDEHPRQEVDNRDVGPVSGPGGVVLRRSWSDPTSYFSYGEEIVAPTRDVGVIGDRGGQGSEGGKHKRALWRGDSIGGAPTSSLTGGVNGNLNAGPGGLAGSPKGLEVSTEIITSPNGHRDLEIKFYSSPSPVEESDKSLSSLIVEEVDDDENNRDDDFRDIWSYHELKLQQDFRTLLQAEE